VGNVWEWVEDWWTTDRSQYPRDNPRGPSYGQEKAKKGGSFMYVQLMNKIVGVLFHFRLTRSDVHHLVGAMSLHVTATGVQRGCMQVQILVRPILVSDVLMVAPNRPPFPHRVG